MKTLLILIFMCIGLQATASTPDLWDLSEDVMYKLGADPRLEPKVLSVTVRSTLGSRVQVEFQYEEDVFGKKTCTYWYDTKTETVRHNSWLCGR